MEHVDCVVVGAGIAGLLAARTLTVAGVSVCVLEQRGEVGGRMATTSVPTRGGTATFDVGAQFLTVQDPRFETIVAPWRDAGRVRTWFEGPPDPDPVPGPVPDRADGEPRDDHHHPRFCGSDGMRALCYAAASGLDVRTGVRVRSLVASDSTWTITAAGAKADGATMTADAVVLAVPTPLALDLADAGGADVRPTERRRLADVSYDPCIAVLALLEESPGLGNAGALRLGGEPLEWIGDNHAKGISDVPCVTLHAGPAASAMWWEEHDAVVGTLLTGAARGHLGQVAQAVGVRRWKHSNPDRQASEDGAALLVDDPPLVVAGDALNGGRVEGAAVSGLAAGEVVAEHLA